MTDIEKVARIICKSRVQKGYNIDTIIHGMLLDPSIKSSSKEPYTHYKWEEDISLAKKIVESLENE